LSTHTSPLALRSARISISTRGSCRRALLEFKVVFFRDQRIDRAQHLAFSRRFGSVLCAIEVPPVGGDTLFADMYAAYDGLSPEMQRWICGLTAVHDIARVFASKLAKKAEELHEKFRRSSIPWSARMGSLAFWDNRSCQHFAASDYFPQRRVMARATIAGDRPYLTP
jgi:taurine dioxygenase